MLVSQRMPTHADKVYVSGISPLVSLTVSLLALAGVVVMAILFPILIASSSSTIASNRVSQSSSLEALAETLSQGNSSAWEKLMLLMAQDSATTNLLTIVNTTVQQLAAQTNATTTTVFLLLQELATARAQLNRTVQQLAAQNEDTTSTVSMLSHELAMVQAQLAYLAIELHMHQNATLNTTTVALFVQRRFQPLVNSYSNFTVSVIDTHSAWRGDRYVTPLTGKYFCSFYAFGTAQYVEIHVNGVSKLAQWDSNTYEISGLLDLAQGDLVRVFSFSTYNNVNVAESGFSLFKISF